MEEETTGAPTSSIKPTPDRDGDEKITVVVPPSKGLRLSEEKGQDKEGDVAMEGVEGELSKQTSETEVDPQAKAVQGQC
jgi:26S proteasome regulatory subunit N3